MLQQSEYTAARPRVTPSEFGLNEEPKRLYREGGGNSLWLEFLQVCLQVLLIARFQDEAVGKLVVEDEVQGQPDRYVDLVFITRKPADPPPSGRFSRASESFDTTPSLSDDTDESSSNVLRVCSAAAARAPFAVSDSFGPFCLCPVQSGVEVDYSERVWQVSLSPRAARRIIS